MCFRFREARGIQLYTDLNPTAGSNLVGVCPRIMARASITSFTTDFQPARLRNALVVGQVAVSVLLLICAMALLRASKRIEHFDIGLRTRGVVAMELVDKFRTATVLRTISGNRRSGEQIAILRFASGNAGNAGWQLRTEMGSIYVCLAEVFPGVRAADSARP
jgi:hypothetical protein